MRRAVCVVFGMFACVVVAGQALAHPHVWVTMRSELLYAPGGVVTGVRHAWTFDEMFSTFATQGLPSKQKGMFTREELAPLAEVNVSSLKDFDFFTHARVDGRKTAFGDPADYFLEFKDGVLTLHFTLPLKNPVKAQSLEIDVYDPTIFVDFSYAEKDPVTLVGAPPQCRLTVARPNSSANQMQQLGEAFFNSLTASSSFGAQFANRVAVKCP